MGIWFSLYGERSEDFIDGVAAGMEIYAVWKDGDQVVGIHEENLLKAIDEMQNDLRGG